MGRSLCQSRTRNEAPRVVDVAPPSAQTGQHATAMADTRVLPVNPTLSTRGDQRLFQGAYLLYPERRDDVGAPSQVPPIQVSYGQAQERYSRPSTCPPSLICLPRPSGASDHRKARIIRENGAFILWSRVTIFFRHSRHSHERRPG